ncbi:MAG: FAD-dependent oxidoreductase [Chthoniobacterales bacterium]
MSKQKTIAVLGGGSAGLTAARTACDLGAHVLLFVGELGARASLCIERGCMPSKAIFEPIDAMHRAKRHGWLEVKPRHPAQYLAEIVAWKDREIAQFRDYRAEVISRLQTKDFEIIGANGRFVSENEIESGGRRYPFDAAIIATGSSNSIPPEVQVPIGPEGAWTNDEILANTELPKSLLTIGAGPVGLEISLRYARLGCAVTIVARSTLLAKFPSKFGERLEKIFEREGVRVLTGQTLAAVTRADSGEFSVRTKGAGGEMTLLAEKVLLATGRHPELSTLNLADAGIAVNARGRLEVECDMRVKGTRRFFAAGDVAGLRMVVHQAHIEAGIAAENAVSDGERMWDRRSNLQVVFTDPEFAFAGQSREMAEKAGHRVVTATAESSDVGKLRLAGDDLGFGEFVADAESGRLLGAALLCDDASNLIHLPGYAIDHGHTVHQLISGEYYHPTKIEIVSEIGDALCRELGGSPLCRARE